MSKKKKITLISISAFLAILFVALMVYYFGASFGDFYAKAQQEFAIPGLDTHFSPQGLTYNQENEMFLVGGYMSKGGPSRVYFIKNGEDKASKYITLTSDGVDYAGHCGGITTYQDNAWIVGDKHIYRFSLTEALNAENESKVEILDQRETGNGADFVLTYTNSENKTSLIVGEFYRKGNYDTSESHHINTADGKVNPALSLIYDLDETRLCGISETPKAGISMPGLVQGMTFNKEGKIVLSTSYGLPASNIILYENVLEKTATHTTTIESGELPVYMLDANAEASRLKAPCMSEEIELVDGRVYVLFENACKKYKAFTRTRLYNVFSLDI